MAAITTSVLAGATEFAGDYKVIKKTFVPQSASDTITLTKAIDGIDEILFVIPKMTAGYDAALTNMFADYSGLTITITSTAAAGTASTNWDGATAELLIIGRNIA
jgi:NAD(P)H-dependent FMN reductase